MNEQAAGSHKDKTALITGITGQDGSYLAELLLAKGYAAYLGNLAAKRDWGYAPDYVRAMWLMLQADEPDDYVVATGEAHSVEEFCIAAFGAADMPIEFFGEGLERRGLDRDGKVRVKVDPRYFRPTEVDFLLGDSAKAREKLGWKSEVTFDELVRRMVAHDMTLIGAQAGSVANTKG